MQTLGLGFTWEQLSPGQRFRTLNRTITETDLVLFTGVTGMLETIFIDRTFAAEKGAIQGQFVPAALTYSDRGTAVSKHDPGHRARHARAQQAGSGAGSRRRHGARRNRDYVGASHLEGQPRHRRVQDRRQEPKGRDGDDLRSDPNAGRPLVRSRHATNGISV